jgi:hypothetical protein
VLKWYKEENYRQKAI